MCATLLLLKNNCNLFVFIPVMYLCVQVNSELFIVETLKIGGPKDSRIWLQSKHLKVSMYYATDHI